MEALVRAITFCDDVDDESSAAKSFGAVAKRRAVARKWTSLTQPGHLGRFVPDTEARAIEEAAAKRAAAPTYEAWLRAQTQSVDTEVNVQLGEYTLKKNTLQPLPPHISADGDFVSVFGVSLNAEGTCFYGMQVEAVNDRIKDKAVAASARARDTPRPPTKVGNSKPRAHIPPSPPTAQHITRPPRPPARRRAAGQQRDRRLYNLAVPARPAIPHIPGRR